MKNVQDIYPLSPLQKGLLFHALFDSRSGAYVERVSWSLRGELDVEVFRSAWGNVVRSHPILRTVFLTEGLDEPLQVVRQHVELPWEYLDWQASDAGEQSARFEALLDEERRCGFRPNEAPLMRLKLVRLGPRHHRFLWSYHHLLLDGWSVALVLREVSEGYEALRRGHAAPPTGSRPYRDYIAWLQRQDMRRAETYWRETLKGFTTPTQPGVGVPAPGETFAPEERYLKHYTDLPAETAGALQALARQHQLTLNPLVQGAWALLLSRYSGEDDVLFGSVVSGRPTDLPGAETMVGLFINTLPLRVSTPPDMSVLGWLQQLQRRQVEMRQFEYSPLMEVQRWSDVRPGRPLFESIVVFRNLPVDEALRQQGGGVQIEELEHHDMATGHPLTMGIVPEKTLRLQLTYDRARYDGATIRRMLGHMTQLLEGMVADPQQNLGSVQMLTPPERAEIEVWNSTARDYERRGLVHELFERLAAERPHQAAVSDDTRSLTYGELDASANRLAR
ncbi:MAG TPA: condensation domain-containing protein, partial [Pyrinomonadaceae bacterium]|nr:condensation domain-containing protein [Pyrinomonadaceae bacterium]